MHLYMCIAGPEAAVLFSLGAVQKQIQDNYWQGGGGGGGGEQDFRKRAKHTFRGVDLGTSPQGEKMGFQTLSGGYIFSVARV